MLGTETCGVAGGAVKKFSTTLKKLLPARQTPTRMSNITSVMPPVVISKKALRKEKEGREDVTGVVGWEYVGDKDCSLL